MEKEKETMETMEDVMTTMEQQETTEDNMTSSEPAAEEETKTEVTLEDVPSMDEFKDEINNSFKEIEEGDIIKGTVIGISDTEVTLDLRYYAEGIIKLEELSNDPRFSIKNDVTIGEEISATVLRKDDGEGNILLSRKRADDILAWEALKEALDNRTVFTVKIANAVNGGVVTFLKGVRAFIPASHISVRYVEDLESYVGKEIEVIVITVDEEKSRLVLSGKEVERDKAAANKSNKISNLQKGLVTTGVVEKIMPYGAFVNIGDGLSGLVHISQICSKRIKTPNEVIKEGQEVKVKVTDIKDGKVSLSMKAVEDKEAVVDDIESAPIEYSSGSEAFTDLRSLLSKLKL